MVEDAAQNRKFYIKASLLFYLSWIVTFEAVGKYAATLPTRDLTLPLDRLIPLMPLFIWPYELCYVFPFLPLLVLKDWHRFNRAILAVILANLTAYVVYVLLPISFPRPQLGKSLSDIVLGMEYSVDFYPGANKLPSLHVAFAWIVYFVCRKQNLKKAAEAFMLLFVILITVSTLFVKQHILVDTVTGVLWAFGAWWLSQFLYSQLVDLENDPRIALKQLLKKVLPFVFLFMAVLFLAADLHWERIVKW